MTPCYQRHELAPGIHVDIPHEHEGVPVKTMAEVLGEHGAAIAYEEYYGCTCGEVKLTIRNGASHASHVADALTAAGFGPVKAAQADAWDEGMEAMYASTSSEWPPILEQNPYRAATIEH